MTATTPTADETIAPALRTFRALKLDKEGKEGKEGKSNVWVEVGCLETEYTPIASEVGERFGAGPFILLEVDDRYPRQVHGVQFTVVAKAVYEQLRDDAEEA